MSSKIVVTMYAICKNERRNCEEWWEHVKEADHVLVLDTGSTDGTDLALVALGATVDYDEFPNGFRFDDARNSALESVKRIFPDTDVFITTDLDERITKGWCDIIKKSWKPERHTRISYSWANEGVEVKSRRNWGHDWEWRWRYPCHEVMYSEDTDSIFYMEDQELNLEKSVTVWHHRDHGKDRSGYLKLLELRYREYPEPGSLAYLLRELSYHDRWDRILDFEEDVKSMNKLGNEPMTCWLHLGMAYRYTRRFEKAEECYEKAIELDGSFRRPYIFLTELLVHLKRYDEAEHVLVECEHKTRYTTRVIFVDDPDFWTWILLDWQGVVAYWRGRYADALIFNTMALKRCPGNLGIQSNIDSAYMALKEHGPEGDL